MVGETRLAIAPVTHARLGARQAPRRHPRSQLPPSLSPSLRPSALRHPLLCPRPAPHSSLLAPRYFPYALTRGRPALPPPAAAAFLDPCIRITNDSPPRLTALAWVCQPSLGKAAVAAARRVVALDVGIPPK